MNYQLLYNKEIAGKTCTASNLYSASSDLKRFVGASTSIAQNEIQTLSGFYLIGTNHRWYLTTSDLWICDVATEVGTNPNVGDGQSQVNTIIRNNAHIYSNNLLCARFASKLTNRELQLLKDLQNRLLVRDGALRNNQLIRSSEESYPAGYIAFSNDLNFVMQTDSIGALATTHIVYIVISAVVAVGLGVYAYFAYKAFADESKKDVQFSDELTAKLISKLTPEEWALLQEETSGIVTKARLKAKFSSVAGIGTTLLWVLAGAGIVYWWNNRSKVNTKSNQQK